VFCILLSRFAFAFCFRGLLSHFASGFVVFNSEEAEF